MRPRSPGKDDKAGQDDQDDKPLLPSKAADPAERKSLLGSLFGGRK